MKGLIFDLDGVITDTAEYHFLSWKKLAEDEGINFTREDNEALRGVPRRASLELVLKGAIRPEADMVAMMERKNNYYLDYVAKMTPANLLEGVHDFLKTARELGFKLGLGSASKNAHLVCELMGILDLFDVLGDGYSVVNAKPSPDLFVWVAGGLGLPLQECVVFEDAEAGVTAGLAGGFYTVGIGPEERVGKAHRRIGGLHAVHPKEFLDKA
jgi:beta-phosphoglucomutase